MIHFLSYCIISEGVTIITIKLDVLLNILGKLDSILAFDILSLSMGNKDLGHPNELLGILGEVPLPFPLVYVKEFIISFISEKGGVFMFFCSMNRLPFICSIFP